jgi:hypothetical protein
VSGIGVIGEGSSGGDGVFGTGTTGVHGSTNAATGAGVRGENFGGGDALVGSGSLPEGIPSQPNPNGAAVRGVNFGGGDGVFGTGTNGVRGQSSVANGTGVLGEGFTGVSGVSAATTPDACGVSATHNHGGIGLRAVARLGTGVSALGAVGGAFEGTTAPLYLVPASAVGRPTSGTHAMGQFYVDAHGALYFCTASGSPGTWKQVQLV